MEVKRMALDGAIARIKSPCMGCTRRVVGCHSACEDYKSYKQQYEAAKIDALKACDADVNGDAYAAISRRRYLKHKRSKKR